MFQCIALAVLSCHPSLTIGTNSGKLLPVRCGLFLFPGSINQWCRTPSLLTSAKTRSSQGSEFVPLTQLRIELYRSTRTRLINQCWRHNTRIYPMGCILISTNLRWTGVLLFWYQYIPVIAWPARGLYFPFRLQCVHDLYHQAPWWSTAQLLGA